MEPWVRFYGCDNVQVFGVLASIIYSIQVYGALFYVAIQVYGALFYGVIQVYGALVTNDSTTTYEEMPRIRWATIKPLGQ